MNTVLVKVISALVLGGEIIAPAKPGKPPKLAEVTKSEAKDLLRRNKVVLATAEDVEAAGVSVAASGTQEPPLNPVIEAHQQDRAEQEAERQAEAEAAKAAQDANSGESDAAKSRASRKK